MLRRSFLRFFTLAESEKMFLDTNGTPLVRPTATLPQTLQVLAEHHHTGGLSLTHAALDWLLSLDATDADSAAIAMYKVSNSSDCSTNMNRSSGIADGNSEYPSPSHLLLQIMSSHANDVAIRERCCRCIANMCQLTPPPSGPHSRPEDINGDEFAIGNEKNDGKSIADALVEQGAVELALGTLAMSLSRLSMKGRAWSALAVLNLVCLSHDGARRAALAKGESVLSDTVVAITHECTHSSEQRLAMDAALGSLARLLTSEADDNAAGISYRYEQAAYGTAEAVGRALVWLSQLFLREILRSGGSGNNNDDADNITIGGAAALINTPGGRREGTGLFFPTASPLEQLAVVSFLPPLHKAWMALKSLSSCPRNLPMVYEALYEPLSGRGLRVVVDTLMLLCVELEGLSIVGATEEARLQQDVLLYAMSTFVDLTATRKDLDRRALTEATETSHDGEKQNDGVSSVIPTEAALSVIDTLAAGAVTTIAVSTTVRVHSTLREAREMGDINIGRAYDDAVFDLLARCVLVLANMAGHDIAVASVNTLTALHALLQDAADILSEIEARWGMAPEQLFSGAAQKDQLVLAQQCALVGQIYAALWGVLRTPDGASAVIELRIQDTVKRLQSVLEKIRDGAFPNSVSAASIEGKNNDASASQQQDHARASMTNATQTAAAAEETMQRLIPLGARVMQCMEIATTTRGAQTEEHQRPIHTTIL